MSPATRSFSFEFFPPKTDQGVRKLREQQAELQKVSPDFYSVTYGAGGSTRDRTMETVLALHRDGLDVAPHISCVGDSRDALRILLQSYRDHGIRRLVALRGDLPSGMGTQGELRYANELVEFIRNETGDHFHIEVAAYPEVHPQAVSADSDLEAFRLKVEAGANGAMTQYFFNADGYFAFCDRCRQMGLNIPIVPGIMPITNYSKLARFSDACGAEIPRWIRKRLEAYGDDNESIAAFGAEVVSRMCEQLLAGDAPGLHFYTLNQAAPSLAIWHNLNLGDYRA